MLSSHQIGANFASTYYLQITSFWIITYVIILTFFLLAVGAKVSIMGAQLRKW